MDTKKPRIGLLGIMQELYDNDLPGITERQDAFAQEVARRLENEADIVFGRPEAHEQDGRLFLE